MKETACVRDLDLVIYECIRCLSSEVYLGMSSIKNMHASIVLDTGHLRVLVIHEDSRRYCEPLGIQRWWYFDSSSVQGNEKFVSLMYKHTPMPPFCYGTVYIRV